MRALALAAQAPIEREPLRLEQRPIPEPGRGEILVRVGACGVCRTDLHLVEGDLPLVRSPVVPGHQVVGRIERAGAGAGRFEAGARVGIAWLYRTCGACAYCASGRENLCERAEFTGYHADGGFADYAVVPEAFAYRIPPAFSDAEAAPLLCAGIIGYRALKRSEAPAGGRLGMYGFGSSAHVTLQVARARGCEVFVCTREASHRELARRLGAAWAGDLREPMPAKTDGAIIFAPVGDLVPLALRREQEKRERRSRDDGGGQPREGEPEAAEREADDRRDGG
ncbi:MAG TPA: zinc-binding alcohol dehydrogenase family protein, partial [Candidatus Limnocylindria bacterium]|nr:zinc-binding alcohol dehydrogenase family protein [Candidatus Limnocylindria bacterium]